MCDYKIDKLPVKLSAFQAFIGLETDLTSTTSLRSITLFGITVFCFFLGLNTQVSF